MPLPVVPIFLSPALTARGLIDGRVIRQDQGQTRTHLEAGADVDAALFQFGDFRQ